MLRNNFSLLKSISLVIGLLAVSVTQARTYHSYTTQITLQTPKKAKKIKKTKYDQLFENKKTETKKSNFLTLHKIDGKILVELPIKDEFKDVLIGATVGNISNPSIATVGTKNTDPLHFQFSVRDSSVVMKLINTDLIEVNKRQNAQKNIAKSFGNITMYSFNIKAYNNDKTRVVFDMTPFFMEENKYFPALQINTQRFSTTYQQESSYIYQIKAFDQNAVIKTEKNFQLSVNSNPSQKYPISVQSIFTIMKLPKEKMIPRASDTRIGVFQTHKYLYDSKESYFQDLYLVNRWRVEPSDVNAYEKGELVEPKKKIVFYIDNAFPDSWKEPIRKGILRWNRAFEKIGFKNVIEAKPFPENDPNFDPDNLNYSCIRYIPRAEENAMGPSWVDPRTGEVINASVFVFGDIAKLIHRWRFIQTSQIDNRVRSKELPQDILDESLEYVVAHEVGHTLGFMHNMKASAAFPVDSLRSVSFSQKYGTTPSIMDYARFNYIAQPQDGNVGLTPPFLGIYDDFLVQWTYQYFPQYKGDFLKEAEALKKMVSEKEKDPRFHYLIQQFRIRIDPSAIEEDLGDDPQKASDYGFSNLVYISQHLDQWITDDEDSRYKTDFYEGIAIQAYMYLNNVNMNIGGVYLLPTREQSGLPRYQVVDKARQKSSALWLLDKAKHFSSYRNLPLEEKLYAVRVPFSFVGATVQKMAVGNILKVSVGEYLDPNSYTMEEYCKDVYQSVFEKTIQGNEQLSADEMELQKTYVDFSSRFTTAALRSVLSIQSREIANDMLSYEDVSEEFAHAIEASQSACLHQHITNPNFGVGYGEPNDLWMQSVDKSLTYVLLYTEKTEKLLQEAIEKTKNQELKAHYKFLLRKVQKALKRNS